MGNGRSYGEQSTVSSYSAGQEGRAGRPSTALCMRTGRRSTVARGSAPHCMRGPPILCCTALGVLPCRTLPVLHCSVPCCTGFHCAASSRTIWAVCAVSCCTVRHCVHCTMPCGTAPQWPAPHFAGVRRVVLYCAALYTLYRSGLHHTLLCCSHAALQ